MTDAVGGSRCCAARHCKTNEETLVNEAKARLFEFPTDPELRQKWKSVCNIDVGETPLLCELHFSQSCFDDEKQLRPDAVPATPVLKRKIDSVSNDDGPCQKKAAPDNQRPLLEVSYPCNSALNGSKPPPKKVPSKNAFRLTIQIDKFPKGERPQNVEQNEPLCLTCNEILPNLQDLYTHVMQHFTCDLCHALFTLRKSLQKHRKLHENNSEQFPFKCLKCDQAFVSEDDIRKHKHPEILDDEPPRPCRYLCKKCQVLFKTKLDYDKHYVDTHAAKKVKKTAKE
ncbi:protein odd-skipped-related 1-like [Trichogramma pretiosum]|uniref:protein odd-skipped-related 1-like n=1 Tax=Trichogramma pretiosum TaxID=7493 RepID=UPI0006C98CA4|nr:protein odd-skipped-related 1-like [Trichogramma pretiosum]